MIDRWEASARNCLKNGGKYASPADEVALAQWVIALIDLIKKKDEALGNIEVYELITSPNEIRFDKYQFSIGEMKDIAKEALALTEQLK